MVLCVFCAICESSHSQNSVRQTWSNGIQLSFCSSWTWLTMRKCSSTREPRAATKSPRKPPAIPASCCAMPPGATPLTPPTSTTSPPSGVRPSPLVPPLPRLHPAGDLHTDAKAVTWLHGTAEVEILISHQVSADFGECQMQRNFSRKMHKKC